MYAMVGLRPESLRDSNMKPTPHESPGWLTAHALAVFAFLYLPIVILILYSFNGQGVGGFPPRDLTLNW